MTAVELKNIRKTYGPKVAVDDISLTVSAGQIFGIIGPNGAGKTMTVECISGLRTPDSGTVRVCGLNPATQHRQLSQLLGVQLQECALPDRLTVIEALDLYASFYPHPRSSAELLDMFNLAAHRTTPYAKLSGGLAQRLSIALALIGNPKVAILDELTTGLDPSARRETWSLIEGVRDTGVTILLVTHFMGEAQRLCDEIAMIDDGRIIAQGSPAALVDRVRGAQTLHFRLGRDLDPSTIAALPGVEDVTVEHRMWTVTGTGHLLATTAGELARRGVIAEELRTKEPNLEDAFVALTTKEDA